jgi:hypothetical protein
MYVVCDLLLAETSECPYILFSDVNLSWIVIPSSSGSTKVEALDNLVMDLRSRYRCTAVSYLSILDNGLSKYSFSIRIGNFQMQRVGS